MQLVALSERVPVKMCVNTSEWRWKLQVIVELYDKPWEEQLPSVSSQTLLLQDSDSFLNVLLSEYCGPRATNTNNKIYFKCCSIVNSYLNTKATTTATSKYVLITAIQKKRRSVKAWIIIIPFHIHTLTECHNLTIVGLLKRNTCYVVQETVCWDTSRLQIVVFLLSSAPVAGLVKQSDSQLSECHLWHSGRMLL